MTPELKRILRATGTKNANQLAAFLTENGEPTTPTTIYDWINKGVPISGKMKVLRSIGIAPNLDSLIAKAPKAERYVPMHLR